MRKALASLLCGISALAVGEVACAQAGPLDEIVVTARKRSESLQDVPVAVSAISQDQLRNNIATDLSKIAELAPQVMISRAVSGTGSVLTIRGISSASVDSGLDQSVSLAIDGVSLSRGRIVQSAMFDLQQIEILEGPQALFFGKNSPAGVISIRSADPTDRFEGYVRAGYEFVANERYGEAAISGPLSPDFKARLAARYSQMDGWIRNVAVPMANPFQPGFPLPGTPQGRTTPDGYEMTGRLTLLWTPTDDFEAKLKVTANRERLNDAAPYNEEFCAGGQTVPTILGVPEVNADCRIDRIIARPALPAGLAVDFPYANGGVPYIRSDLVLGALTLEKSFGDVSLSSTTGYYYQTHRGAYNGDRSEYVQIFAADTEKYDLFNQELRLDTEFDGPVNAMVGAYYEYAHRDWLNAPSVLNVFDPVAQNYATLVAQSTSKNQSMSVFGQLRWKILPELELAGGARYTHDSKRTAFVNTQTNLATATGRGAYPQGQTLLSRYSGNNVSPEVTLTWKPDPDQTIYAGYKTGYKAGGISSPAILPATATPENVLFGPEKVKGFEAGYKAELFDRRVRLNLTAYRYNYNGLQVTAFDSVRLAFSLRNAARARTTGVTGSFEWAATDALTLSGNAGYNRARYLSFANAQCHVGQTVEQGCVNGVQDLSGRTLNRAPRFTFRLGADYRADLSDDWIADLSLSASHSSSYQTQADYTEGGFQDAYWLLNAALRLSPRNERYRLSVVGRNLTNSYYKITTNNQSLGTPNQYTATFSRPREVLVELGFNF